MMYHYCKVTFLVLLHCILLPQAGGIDIHLAHEHVEDDFVLIKPKISKRDTVPSNANGQAKRAIEFEAFDKYISLALDCSPTINEQVPVYTMMAGKIVKLDTKPLKGIEFCQDVANGASMSFKAVDNKQDLIEGLITYSDDDYVIAPAKQEHLRRKRSEGDENYHILYKIKHSKADAYVGDFVEGKSEDSRYNDFDVTEEDLLHRRKKRAGKINYQIEVMMVIDYKIYSRWYNASNAVSAADKDADAIDKIRYYFAHVANGIDLRYKSIVVDDYSVLVRVVSYFVAKDAPSSPWTETPAFKEANSPRDYLNASAALTEFTEWINSSNVRNNMPSFDHAMLMTYYDIFNGLDGQGNKKSSVVGLAPVSQICMEERVSINEDSGGFSSINTCAHELGHNLGALHDGDGNGCNAGDLYIMTAVATSNFSDDKISNLFRFSNCSIDAFRNLTEDLTSAGKNCLTNAAAHEDEANFLAHMQKLPGQMYQANEQCRQMFGPESYYCMQGDPDQLCKVLYCYSPQSGNCAVEGDTKAARGTTCGNKKWCIEGVCTYDANAPEADENCPQGNQLGKIYGNSNDTCQDYASRNDTSECYTEHFRKVCCQLCGDVYRANDTGCEYGDKDKFCIGMAKHLCYSNNDTCCRSCEIETADCPYGDHDLSCSNITSHSCYLDTQDGNKVADVCCGTCGAAKTGDAGCQYGDKDAVCTNKTSYDCYLTSGGQPISDICCAKCKTYETGVQDCQYGDKNSACTSSEKDTCYKNSINCCKLCGDAYQNVTGCEYGDLNTGYCRNITNSSCYDQVSVDNVVTNISNYCCETCPKYYTGDDACAYGDREPDFCSAMQTYKCDYYKETCCKTCKPYYTGVAGCEYGDKIDCSAVQPHQCYGTFNYYGTDTPLSEVCCSSCQRVHTGNSQCPYGDKTPDCKTTSNICSVENNWNICCFTCADELGITFPTEPTTEPATTTTPTTTTTTTTTTSTTTTSPTITTDTATVEVTTAPPKTVFSVKCQMRITSLHGTSLTYTSDLQDSTSQTYINLEKQVCEIQTASVENNPSCKVSEFKAGSVVAITVLSFEEPTGGNGINTTVILEQISQSVQSNGNITASNITVDDVDECTDGGTTCSEYATCTNTVGGYTCQCQSNYNVDNSADKTDYPGRYCAEECSYSSCKNGGTCTAQTDGPPVCTCSESYSGDQCETKDEFTLWGLSLTMVIIIFGTIGFVLLLGILILVICCCGKKNKVAPSKEEEKGGKKNTGSQEERRANPAGSYGQTQPREKTSRAVLPPLVQTNNKTESTQGYYNPSSGAALNPAYARPPSRYEMNTGHY